MITERAELLYRAENELGEGPFTLDGAGIFWFDIFGSSAYRLDVGGVHSARGDRVAAGGGRVDVDARGGRLGPAGGELGAGENAAGRIEAGENAAAGKSGAAAEHTGAAEVQKTDLDHFLCCAGAAADGGIIAAGDGKAMADSGKAAAKQHLIVAAGQNGLELLDENFRRVRLISLPPFDTEILRFNDGKVGPDGAFWAGSMSYNGDKAIGGLYRFGGAPTQILDGMVIPNGLGWSPDGRTMYVTDSGKGVITRWDFDPESGSIVNEQFFVRIPPEEGAPDGLSVDEEGNVWSARWGGARVVGFDPDGAVIGEIEVPAGNPTSCCFGGPDNRTLFITSARHGLAEPGRADGALYQAKTGTRGQVPHKFRFV